MWHASFLAFLHRKCPKRLIIQKIYDTDLICTSDLRAQDLFAPIKMKPSHGRGCFFPSIFMVFGPMQLFQILLLKWIMGHLYFLQVRICIVHKAKLPCYWIWNWFGLKCQRCWGRWLSKDWANRLSILAEISTGRKKVMKNRKAEIKSVRRVREKCTDEEEQGGVGQKAE